jgi:hypothetical protein
MATELALINDLHRLANSPMAKEMLEEIGRRETVEREASRRRALDELPKVDAEARAALGPIDRELNEARKAESAALRNWEEARAKSAALRTRRALVSARFDARRRPLQHSIEAVVPRPVADFLAWCTSELRTLGRVNHATELGEPRIQFTGPFTGYEVCDTLGNGPAIVARGEALSAAWRAATQLANQDIPLDALEARLESLKAGIPPIEFVELTARPPRDIDFGDLRKRTQAGAMTINECASIGSTSPRRDRAGRAMAGPPAFFRSFGLQL